MCRAVGDDPVATAPGTDKIYHPPFGHPSYPGGELGENHPVSRGGCHPPW